MNKFLGGKEEKMKEIKMKQGAVFSFQQREEELRNIYEVKSLLDLTLRNQTPRRKELRELSHYMYMSSIYQVRLLSGENIDCLVEEIFDSKQMIADPESGNYYSDFHLHALTDAYFKLVHIGYQKDDIVYKKEDDSKHRVIRVYQKEMKIRRK